MDKCLSPLVVDEKFVRRKRIYEWALSIRATDINLNVSLIKLDIEKLMTMLDILRVEEIDKRDVVIEMYKDRVS